MTEYDNTCGSSEAFQILGFSGGTSKQRHHAIKHLMTLGHIVTVRPGGVGGRPPVVLDRESVHRTKSMIDSGEIRTWRALEIALGISDEAPAAIEDVVNEDDDTAGESGSHLVADVVTANRKNLRRFAKSLARSGRNTSPAFATWYALLECGAEQKPVGAADVSKILLGTETSASNNLRELCQAGLVIRHRIGKSFQFMIAGPAADEWSRAATARPVRMVRVASDELDNMRRLSASLRGVDTEALLAFLESRKP